MKKRHAPSFLFSLVVHILALLIFFYTYKYVVHLNQKKSEKKVCICLETCLPEKKMPKKKVKKIEEIKKVPPKKIVPKKIKKKKAPKKEKKKIIKPLLSVPVIKKEIEKPKEIKQESIVEELNTTSEPVNKTVDVAVVQQKKYINDNLAKISQLLSDNLYYPRRARKRGIVGEVIVRFNILQDGSVNTVKVISSNSEILSEAATKTIEDLSKKFPKPNQQLTIQIPIEYKLH